MEKFEVAIIGAGPGGYEAAIRCSQLGLKTVCIDKWIAENGKPALGGTCLNVGCIPSKVLLDTSEHYDNSKNHLHEYGITIADIEIDIEAMQTRKQSIVSSLTSGVETLFIKNKIVWKQGSANLVTKNRIKIVALGGKQEEIEATHIIIATGSVPATHPKVKVDQQRILDSTGALSLTTVPKTMAVIGGGVIGLELGSVWQRLGSEVIIFNRKEQFLNSADVDIGKQAYGLFQEQGLNIKLGATVEKITPGAQTIKLNYHDQSGDHSIGVDFILVAVGRKPFTDGLNAAQIGVDIDDAGYIKTDNYCATSIDNIYAIGDCTRGPMLAHRASEEGIALAERITGQKSVVNYEHIPWVIYTWPEIAWVGQTEQQLQQSERPYRVGKFPFFANGRAKAMGQTKGLVKVIADGQYDTLLGVHIFGANASELISEAVVAMEFGASAEDLARIVHAHPTLSEAIHEAALAVDKRAIHI